MAGRHQILGQTDQAERGVTAWPRFRRDDGKPLRVQQAQLNQNTRLTPIDVLVAHRVIIVASADHKRYLNLRKR